MTSTVDHFEFIDQHGETISSDELQDDWWIAYFFYTNCRMVCPRTTAHILDIHDTLRDDGITPPIVGFSIDPDFDTPEVLQEFAKDYGINDDNITFLTGYDFDTIQKLSNESFQSVLIDGGPEDHLYVHSTAFFLVNPKGEVIKQYDGLSNKDHEELIADVKKVM